MMISDEPDEDADGLDDDKLLEAYLNPSAKDPANREPVLELRDWPGQSEFEIGLRVDQTTLDWFRSRHADWQREMRFVLRAWVVAQTAEQLDWKSSLPSETAPSV